MTVRTLMSVVGMIGIAAGSFAYMDHLGLPLAPSAHVRTVSMNVPDTNGLVVGSRVLLRGVAVGHISQISPSADHISVEWNFDRRYSIPVDSHFRIDNLSALGEAYLAVLPESESGPYLQDRAVLDSANVTVPTTFQELSARLTRMLEQVEPQRVGQIFQEMNVALPDDVQVLGNLSHAGQILATTLVTQTDSFTKLLNTVQPLLQDSSWMAGDLAGVAQDATALTHNASAIANAFHHAVLVDPLPDATRDGVTPLIGELQKFLDNNSPDLQKLGVDLLPAARAGAASMQTVDISALLDNALSSANTNGSITIHVYTHDR
ncbi:MlaD family protein [Nocardia nova]|uniref:MlaD family protein n=1 Tax=Nocardia nova TaxID=37330 RepID=UPI003787F4C4